MHVHILFDGFNCLTIIHFQLVFYDQGSYYGTGSNGRCSLITAHRAVKDIGQGIPGQ
jgi:hypothetical protein